MQLVDAIEAWGRAHRSSFESGEAETLADVWRTVKASEHADLDVASMTKEQARAVMGVFDSEDRSSVASTLNKVRKWTIAQANEAESGPDTGSVAVVEDRVEERAEPALATEGPASATEGMVTIDGSGMAPSARDTLPASGPVEGWQPPTAVDDPPAAIDQRIILGLIGLLLAVVLVWALFLRGDDASSPAPADETPEAVDDVVTITNQAFLDQFELTPEVGECLVDEFGDLASAATDATLRERQVCGTSLLQIITESS